MYYRTPKELEKAIKDLIKKGQSVMPVLLFLYKEC